MQYLSFLLASPLFLWINVCIHLLANLSVIINHTRCPNSIVKVADGKKKHYLIEVEEDDPLGFLGKEQRQTNEARIFKDEARRPLDYSVSRRFRRNY